MDPAHTKVGIICLRLWRASIVAWSLDILNWSIGGRSTLFPQGKDTSYHHNGILWEQSKCQAAILARQRRKQIIPT